MKKYIVFLFLLVFVAGCVGSRPVQVEANNGLKIVEFSADPTTAEFNDNVLFTVGVENVGGTTARNAMLKLYGIENIWKKSVGGGTVGSNDPDVTSTFNNEAFDPPVQSQNRPGDQKFFARTFLPPELPEGVEQDFPVTARLTFDYSTTGSIIVPTISKSLLRIKANKGEAVESSPRMSNSFGPLQISLLKGTLPIVVDETRTDEQEATFVFEFQNTGDGFPVTEVGGQTGARTLGLLQGSMTVSGPGGATGVKFDPVNGCLGFTPSGNTITFNFDPTRGDILKLRSDGRLPLACTIKIQRSAFTPTTSGIISFSIQMNYKYFIEKTVNVHVIGKEAGAIGGGGISSGQPTPGTVPAPGGPPAGAPSVILTTPEKFAPRVPSNIHQILITFNKELNPNALPAKPVTLNGRPLNNDFRNEIVGTTTLNRDGKTLEFNFPDELLRDVEPYTFKANPLLQSFDGFQYGVDETFSFTTFTDPNPPVPSPIVTSRDPFEGARPSPSTNIIISFNRPMNTASVESALAIGVDTIPFAKTVQGTVTWGPGNTVLTFTPSARLSPLTDYRIQISTFTDPATGKPSYAKSQEGKYMVPFVSKFRTLEV